MRRLVLSLAFATATWSQIPPRPEAPPPITVKIEQSPESVGTTLSKLVIPTVLGAGLALFGVWLTTRKNAAENKANREHQLEVEREKARIAAEAKSLDNRWEFRKDIHVNLNKATVGVLMTQTKLLQFALLRNDRSEVVREDAWKMIRQLQVELNSNAEAFWSCVALAPLATADAVRPIVERAYREMGMPIRWDADPESQLQRQLYATSRCLEALQTAACKDLWGEATPFTAAKAEEPPQDAA